MNIQSPLAKTKPWPTAPQTIVVAVDPIVLQIVEGTLNSIEAEIEFAIERTARSPMIREEMCIRDRHGVGHGANFHAAAVSQSQGVVARRAPRCV